MKTPPASPSTKQNVFCPPGPGARDPSVETEAESLPLIQTRAAILLGVLFLLGVILHFIPAASPDRMLLGVFHVNAEHNVLNLISAAVAILCGLASVAASRVCLRIFGIVYGLIAALGFVQGDAPLFGLISNNLADSWLHGAIATASLALGFGIRGKEIQADRVDRELTAPPAGYQITVQAMDNVQCRRGILRRRPALHRPDHLRLRRSTKPQGHAQFPHRLP